MKPLVLIAAAGTLLASASAEAATITRAFEFYATNFAPDAPLAWVEGKFTVTFDPAVASSGSLDSLKISYPGLQFTAANTGFSVIPTLSGLMTVGGTAGGVGSLATNTSDFLLRFGGAGRDPFGYLPLQFSYSTGTGTSWTGDFQMTLGTVAPGVPEPATWGLMILGFGAVGAGMRRRSAKVRYAAA